MSNSVQDYISSAHSAANQVASKVSTAANSVSSATSNISSAISAAEAAVSGVPGASNVVSNVTSQVNGVISQVNGAIDSATAAANSISSMADSLADVSSIEGLANKITNQLFSGDMSNIMGIANTAGLALANVVNFPPNEADKGNVEDTKVFDKNRNFSMFMDASEGASNFSILQELNKSMSETRIEIQNAGNILLNSSKEVSIGHPMTGTVGISGSAFNAVISGATDIKSLGGHYITASHIFNDGWMTSITGGASGGVGSGGGGGASGSSASNVSMATKAARIREARKQQGRNAGTGATPTLATADISGGKLGGPEGYNTMIAGTCQIAAKDKLKTYCNAAEHRCASKCETKIGGPEGCGGPCSKSTMTPTTITLDASKEIVFRVKGKVVMRLCGGKCDISGDCETSGCNKAAKVATKCGTDLNDCNNTANDALAKAGG